MTSFEPNRIVNRQSPQFQLLEGTGMRLYTVPTPPPGPWRIGFTEFFDLPTEAYSEGTVVAVERVDGGEATYNQLYVYIDNHDNEDDWNPWKKVDLNFPKIDPRTGRPYDQYLEWYSPLAK